jgi:hypothetical protein
MNEATAPRKIYGLSWYCARIHWQIRHSGKPVAQGSKLVWGIAWRQRTKRFIRLAKYVTPKAGDYNYSIWREDWHSSGKESLRKGSTLCLNYDLTVFYD